MKNLGKLKINLGGESVISKRLKISKAQQTMLLAVGAASIMLGVAGVLSVYFIKYIAFNNTVITEKQNSINGYSRAIAKSGACKAPKGEVYDARELRDCIPDNVDVNDVKSSLKYNVLVNMANNKDLESVARNSISVCRNPDTNKKYTYDELLKKYEDAGGDSERLYYLDTIKACSALRVIPDALPMKENNEAMLASLNQIFLISGWTPESLAPNSDKNLQDEVGLHSVPVALKIEADSGKTMTVINNMEKSIREFDVETAKVEWSGGDRLTVNVRANAYYTGEVSTSETTKTVRATDKKKGQ